MTQTLRCRDAFVWHVERKGEGMVSFRDANGKPSIRAAMHPPSQAMSSDWREFMTVGGWESLECPVIKT